MSLLLIGVVIGVPAGAALAVVLSYVLSPAPSSVELFSSRNVVEMERQIAANPHDAELWRRYHDYRAKFVGFF